jgi:hypothetical protein
MDNTIDQVTPATNEGQEQELEINLDTPEESIDVLKEQLAKEREAKRQILARAKAAEETAKKLKETSTPPPAPTPKNDSKGYDLDEVTDLRLDGYSKDEVKFIMQNGGRKALEDNSFVKVAIEKIREQKKAEQAIPEMESGKSEVERKYTQEQLSKMSAEELYKILPKSSNA